MNLLTIVTIGFLVLEGMNVLVLYMFPSSKYANAVGVFSAWEKSKADPEIHAFVRYLVNWVAGTKLIFIALLIVILIMADEKTLLAACVALVFSITSFFWRLYPSICNMDRRGQIEPKNYSKALGWMITSFIVVFAAAVVAALV